MNYNPEFFVGCESSDILRMIVEGATDKEILRKYPRWTAKDLSVCRKIVNGTTAKIEQRRVYTLTKHYKPRVRDTELDMQISRMYAENGSIRGVARTLNVSRTMVRAALAANEITARGD